MALTDYLARDLFAGRTAFVTGGASGVNLAIARGFAELGAGVGLCGRSADRLEAARDELSALGAAVATTVADVRDPAAVAGALEHSGAELGPADVVVCGAAGNFLAAAEGISSNGFRAVLDIDVLGSFHAAHAAFDQLRETSGNLLFVSGGQAEAPFAGQAHVAAAKAGVEGLMRNLALEWGRFGIRANSLVPGPVAGTEGMRRLAEAGGEEPWRESVALSRFAEPGEIAAMAAVLASPLASFVTGAQVVVDGGLQLRGSGLINQDGAAGAAQPGSAESR